MPGTRWQQGGKPAAVVTLGSDVGEHPLLEQGPVRGVRGRRFCRVSVAVHALRGAGCFKDGFAVLASLLTEHARAPVRVSYLRHQLLVPGHRTGSGVSNESRFLMI